LLQQAICYHGTTAYSATQIVQSQTFLPSQSDALRLGEGAYFFLSGKDVDYAAKCAREFQRFKYSKNQTRGPEYAVLSCEVIYDDDTILDLCDPEVVPLFHYCRHSVAKLKMQQDPLYTYEKPEHLDAAAILLLKDISPISVVKSMQYFGLLANEDQIKMKRAQKSFVANIIMVCVDTNRGKIQNIKIVERGNFNEEYQGAV